MTTPPQLGSNSERAAALGLLRPLVPSPPADAATAPAWSLPGTVSRQAPTPGPEGGTATGCRVNGTVWGQLRSRSLVLVYRWWSTTCTVSCAARSGRTSRSPSSRDHRAEVKRGFTLPGGPRRRPSFGVAQRIPVSQRTATSATARATTATCAGSTWHPVPGPGAGAVARMA